MHGSHRVHLPALFPHSHGSCANSSSSAVISASAVDIETRDLQVQMYLCLLAQAILRIASGESA